MDYKVIYSDRRTVGLTISNGILTIRAPRGVSLENIEKIVKGHASWIEKNLKKSIEKLEKSKALTESQIKALKKEARIYFKEKIKYYSELMGLQYTQMKITSAKKRFGSCNSKGVICFSYRLMLYPEAARDYVVVHELAHIVQMNHSKAFYDVIKTVMPNYKENQRLLKS